MGLRLRRLLAPAIDWDEEPEPSEDSLEIWGSWFRAEGGRDRGHDRGRHDPNPDRRASGVLFRSTIDGSGSSKFRARQPSRAAALGLHGCARRAWRLRHRAALQLFRCDADTSRGHRRRARLAWRET